MIIRKTQTILLHGKEDDCNYWGVSYILDTKYRHYKDLLVVIMSFCNHRTTISGDRTLISVWDAYDTVLTDKPLHTAAHDAIKHISSFAHLSYKNPFKPPRHHELTLTVRWSEGKNYIQDIDNAINKYLKQHCLFPTKLKMPKEG